MHPYKSLPSTAFWSRAVSRHFDARSLLAGHNPLIRSGESVASAGSCFAANIIPFLENGGFRYVRTEASHPLFSDVSGENFGYGNFSAAYGNVYTARQLLQLLRRSKGEFKPRERVWRSDRGLIDPYRPGLKSCALTDREFDLLQDQHLRATREAFIKADVFVFTLGLTEAWVSRSDEAVFPACPGTIAGKFDPAEHAFLNFTTAQVAGDLADFASELRELNNNIRIILTVSPVPLVATASGNHVLTATVYSKSVLRVACEEVCSKFDYIDYFPSYEIVTGPQASETYFEADKRNVSSEAIEAVMSVFINCCEIAGSVDAPDDLLDITRSRKLAALQSVSSSIVAAECEEMMMEK